MWTHYDTILNHLQDGALETRTPQRKYAGPCWGLMETPLERSMGLSAGYLNWAAVWELKFSYHKPATILFTVYPYYGTLN